MYRQADTIVAVATAPGEAAIGVVRLSGPEAVAIADRSFRPHGLRNADTHRLHHGWFVSGDQDLDEVLVSVMRGPASYTGEDTVEFSCHGGPYLLRRVVEALVRLGARQAERGEFTRRAFLNGKLDLTQAEAVVDLIQATTDLSLSSSFFRLRGGLKDRYTALAEDLRQGLTLLEAGLDFAEDAQVEVTAVTPVVVRALSEVQALIQSYRKGRLIREGAGVTIAGRPNVGKSSLMNRLLEEERAIVTPVPGTTRDTIEESVDLEGLKVRLVDTAGIRESGDPAEAEGTRRSVQAVEAADLVLLTVDASLAPDERDAALLATLAGRRRILVLNKLDLGVHREWEDWDGQTPRCRVCALSGEGLDALRTNVRQQLLEGEVEGQALVTHERHRQALEQARVALERTKQALEEGRPGEIVAMELRGALTAVGAIVGETTPEDILDRVFQTFCIGK